VKPVPPARAEAKSTFWDQKLAGGAWGGEDPARSFNIRAMYCTRLTNINCRMHSNISSNLGRNPDKKILNGWSIVVNLLSSDLRLTGCGDRHAIEIGPCRVAPPVLRARPRYRGALPGELQCRQRLCRAPVPLGAPSTRTPPARTLEPPLGRVRRPDRPLPLRNVDQGPDRKASASSGSSRSPPARPSAGGFSTPRGWDPEFE
jgi:hypothetical protein